MNAEKYSADERKIYYAKAQSWAQDIHKSLRLSRRLAFLIAAVACCIAVLEAVALIMLLPLKTVVPYMITVDRQTGYMEAVTSLKPGALAQDQAVIQSFLAQYVLARESFDMTDLQENYRKVASWTGGLARNQYVAMMQQSNPSSPINLNDRSTIINVVIKSITLLSPASALVRFDGERHIGAAPPVRQQYMAVIAFRYTGAPARMEDRLLNPLGFQVTSYRRDAETVVSQAPGIRP